MTVCFFISLLRLLAVYLFYEFDKFWLAEQPANIMLFNEVKDKFVASVLERLRQNLGPSLSRLQRRSLMALPLEINSNLRVVEMDVTLKRCSCKHLPIRCVIHEMFL